MNIEDVRNFCLRKPGVTESFPFNETTLVFKVAGKMFALLDLSEENRGITIKSDPEIAVQLREQFKEVTPAYHMSKKHWNGISLNGNLKEEQVTSWINASYDLVVKSLTKKQKEGI